MTGIEITLILIGIVLIFASFFIQEKLTHKEMGEIAGLSEKQLNFIHISIKQLFRIPIPAAIVFALVV